MQHLVLSAYISLLLFSQQLAADIVGQHDVTFYTADREPLVIATITFTAAEQGYDFTIAMREELFENHFLSMRPFRCIEGQQMLCHVPYPYEKTRHIHTDDLADLEYEFLFIEKTPKEHGINPWNGRYYKMQWDETGITGALHVMDLNIISSPPEDGNRRPIEYDMMDEVEAETHWLPKVEIAF